MTRESQSFIQFLSLDLEDLEDQQLRVGCGGVDLNPSAALIPFKLLILRYAKLAQLAKTANLSYTFLTL